MPKFNERQLKLLQEIYSSNYLAKLVVNDLPLFKEVITLMVEAYDGLKMGSTRTRGLLRACEKLVELDDVATLQFLVDMGLEIPENNLSEVTTLMIFAAEQGKLNSVKFLFEKGYKHWEHSCDKALMAAIDNGDVSIINFILDNNQTIYTTESHHYPAEELHRKLIYTVKKAMDKPTTDREQFHAIFASLIHHGADLEGGLRALRRSAHDRKLTIEYTQLLLEFIDRFKGQMTEDYYQKLVVALQEVRSVINGENLIWALYGDKNAEAVQLIEQGASLNNYDENFSSSSISPLHVAAGKNNLVVAKALLAHGAEVNYQRSFAFENDFAVDLAIKNQYLDMTILLLSAGAKVSPKRYSKAPDWVKDLIDGHITQPGRSELISGLQKITAPVRYGLFNYSPAINSSNVSSMIVEERVEIPEEGESEGVFSIQYV